MLRTLKIGQGLCIDAGMNWNCSKRTLLNI